MQSVLIDASSAILLYKADLFSDCARAFSLVMAREVFKEVTVKGYPGADFFRTMGAGIRVDALNNIGDEIKMDRGEQETLALFSTQKASFIIMDDGKGAKYCCAQGIPFINALLVPKVFWYSGGMDKGTYIKKTERLITLGRYSQKIINKARALTQKDLAGFIPDEF